MHTYTVGISRISQYHMADTVYTVEANTWREAKQEAEARFRVEHDRGTKHFTVYVRDEWGVTVG